MQKTLKLCHVLCVARETVLCPRCGRRSPTRAPACPFCGAPQGRASGPRPAAPAAPSFYARAIELSRKGRQREALELIEQGLGQTPPGPAHAELWRGKAEVLLATGRRVEALRSFDKAIELDAGDREAWLARGRLLAQQGKRDDALKSVDKVLALEPKHSAARKLRTELMGQAPVAPVVTVPVPPPSSSLTPALGIPSLRGAAPADPLLERPQALFDQGRAADALALVEDVLEKTPRSGHGLLLRARCLAALKKWDEAPAAFERALQQLPPGEPMAVTARFQQGQLLADMGRYPEAVRAFDEAAMGAPSSAEVWFAKGSAEMRAGMREDAHRSLTRFLSLAPPRLATQIELVKEWIQRMA